MRAVQNCIVAVQLEVIVLLQLNKECYTHYMSRKIYMEKWRGENKEHINKYRKNWYRETRNKAVKIVGRGSLRCCRCGIDEYSILQINHKNGGGAKEHRKLSAYTFYRKIVNGERKIDDLDLLCKACNYVHLAEMIGGENYSIIVKRI